MWKKKKYPVDENVQEDQNQAKVENRCAKSRVEEQGWRIAVGGSWLEDQSWKIKVVGLR